MLRGPNQCGFCIYGGVGVWSHGVPPTGSRKGSYKQVMLRCDLQKSVRMHKSP
jgi:hypothetical protein